MSSINPITEWERLRLRAQALTVELQYEQSAINVELQQFIRDLMEHLRQERNRVETISDSRRLP